MTKKVVYIFYSLLILFLMNSCARKSVEVEKLVKEQIENLTGKEMVRELLIANDEDYEQLSRIFKCSPSSLKRILDGETFPTEAAKSELGKLLTAVKINGTAALKEVDPKYNTLGFRFISFTRLKSSVIVIAIASFAFWVWLPFSMGPANGGILFIIGGVLTFLLIYYLLLPSIGHLIYWIESMFINNFEVIDKFKNTIDFNWEVSI